MKTAVRDTKKRKKKYPFIGYRPSVDMDARLRRLADKTALSMSQIIQQCLTNQIGAMEAKWGVK